MSDTATELTPDQQAAPPEPEPQAQPQGDGDGTPLNLEDEAAVDAALAENAIEIPGDGPLVPMSEAGKVGRAYRQQIKDLKAELANAKDGSARAATLEQQIAGLNAKIQELQPYVSAYQAMTQAAQQAAPGNAEDDAEAEEYARLLDLYTPDGKPDLERGKKGLALQRRLADAAAQRHVAPIQQQTVEQQASYNLARAKQTLAGRPDLGVDPNVLDALAANMDRSALANADTVKWLIAAAIGATTLGKPVQQQAQPQRAANGQFAAQQVPPPMFTERAGGKVDQNTLPLSKQELDYIKASGMTEKDYLAATPPWMRK